MEFEWNDDKERQNIAKHGVRFTDACKIFNGFALNAVDDSFDYGEVREISIGMIDGLAFVTVVHTDRSSVCRIISARPAVKSERKRYEQALRQAFDARATRAAARRRDRHK